MRTRWSLAIPLLAAAAVSCGREEVSHFRVPKPARVAAAPDPSPPTPLPAQRGEGDMPPRVGAAATSQNSPSAPPAQREGDTPPRVGAAATSQSPSPPAPPAQREGDTPARVGAEGRGGRAAALRWTLPSGWTEAAGGAMRFATLKPPVKGNVDASVVVLPGPAGGELANVNRWRGQIGLPALDPAGLSAARQVIRTKAGELKVYDFTSEGTPRSRLLGGLTEAEGQTWFVKMTGDADAVGAARNDFMKLLGSLRFE